MSFAEEWAEQKAIAFARQQELPRMRLNQVAADGGQPVGSAVQGDGFSVDAVSVNGNSHLLMELAGLLYEGRMDGENATVCRVPRAHPAVASTVETFARFAQDQYDDMVLLLASLSTRLTSAGNAYTVVDQGVQAQMNAMLDCGRYVPPESR
ncbi:hypothetical protein [Streptomyces sp. NBC_01443]|uniref:hypothetical protein n=1 Tax=Streptomyces sp. NBC_01443 TaxID=2903868 RepID=UPI0022563CCE|nr:hypothetical protein [Streptomyces sp. NBC_01443]MCX4633171.1 hypothetical protein [Streptomyces sp. NBC_01443]